MLRMYNIPRDRSHTAFWHVGGCTSTSGMAAWRGRCFDHAMTLFVLPDSEPRFLCGMAAALVFSYVAAAVHVAALGTALSSVVYHIMQPVCAAALWFDLVCNLVTCVCIVPHTPLTSQLMVLCIGVNWLAHRLPDKDDPRHLGMSELQHVLQVTIPLSIVCLTMRVA